MNAISWLVAGGVVATLAFYVLGLNAARGLVVAVLIGAFAAYFGGSVLTRLFKAAADVPADFNGFSFMVAGCTAVVATYVADAVSERFGA